MKAATRIFLVVLRLVIGWHFLVEGLYKFDAPWSSEAYLRESSGPLAPAFRGIAGDSVTDKLTLLPAEDDVPADSPDRFPPALARDWDFYRDRFIEYYELNDPENQRLRGEVDNSLRQSKAQFVHWVLNNRSTVVVASPYSAEKAEYKKTIAERLEDFSAKKDEIARLQSEALRPSHEAGKFAHLRAEKELADARKDLAVMRASLQGDLREQTEGMEKAMLATLEQEDATSDRLLMSEPHRLVWRDWTPRQRALWFGYWALLILASWGLFASLGWTSWNTRAWSPGRWSFWVLWTGAILVGAIGITCLLGTPWWRGWTPLTFDVHSLTGWLHVAAGIGWVISALLVMVGLLVRAVGSKRGRVSTLIDSATSVAVTATGLWLVMALLLQFGTPWVHFNRLEWADGLVCWGLVTIGACLLSGFCTRTSALVGALVVISFWLAMPPLPWLPPSPMSEGHYLWINKNVIEGIALLVLASTAVGQWAGVDGVLRFLKPSAARTKVAIKHQDDEVIEVVAAD